jgi:membrane-bound inhibitor of C-type lysozyme
MNKLFVYVVALIVIALIVAGYYKTHVDTKEGPTLLNSVSYACNEGKTINAQFYDDPSKAQEVVPGEPPIPTGSVSLVLSDGRQMTLPQTISASGVRYANADESFVFWSKGNGALVLENNEEKSYIGCVRTAAATANLPEVYVNGTEGFSIRYPHDYSVNSSYAYQALGPGKDIYGVKFTIPASLAEGTNLSSSDTGVSVETIPQTNECAAGLFAQEGAKVSTVTEGDSEYSVAETSDAGAGNFYEEKIWAMPGTNPCMAVRYFIHSTNIGNYPEGTVKEFDRATLLNEFDQIRHSLVIN